MLLSVRKYHQNIRSDTTDVLLRAVVGSIAIINTIIIINTSFFNFFVQINKLQNTKYIIKQVNKSQLSI